MRRRLLLPSAQARLKAKNCAATSTFHMTWRFCALLTFSAALGFMSAPLLSRNTAARVRRTFSSRSCALSAFPCSSITELRAIPQTSKKSSPKQATVKTNTLKPRAALLLLRHPAPEAEKWQPAFLSSITSICAELKPVTQSLKPFQSGTSRSAIRSTLPMRPQPQTSTM